MPEKQINRDWTLKEKRFPRKNDVVIDPAGEYGFVIKSKGDFLARNLWVENVDGILLWEDVPSEGFELCNHEHTRDFYLKYKEKKGWLRNEIYKLKDKDFPLLLIDMEYDLVNQEMVYVFRDLTSQDIKYVKTLNEAILEFVSEETRMLAKSAFIEDSSSSLRYKVNIALSDKGEEYHEQGWSVSGGSLSFGEFELANDEINRWAHRMKIRRIASVLSNEQITTKSEIAISESGELYIRDFTGNSGQPGVFNSKVAAALALTVIPKEIWRSALGYQHDTYML